MPRRVVTPGLAPSNSLAPSNTLPPADTIYGGAPITPHQIYLGTAAGGKLQDTSAYVEFGEGVTLTYGRSNQFDTTSPGTLTFTLNNSDGRFTPENPASPLAVKVIEGMTVGWQLGSRLMLFQISTVEIPADIAAWHQLVVTCDDTLATAGRHAVLSIPDGLLARYQPKLIWLLDEESGSTAGLEKNMDGLGPFTLTRSNPSSMTGGYTFGTEQTPGLPGTALTLTAGGGETNWFGTTRGNTNRVSSVQFPAQTTGQNMPLGWWNFWVYPGSTINLAVVPKFGTDNPGYNWSAQIQCTPTSYTVKPGTSGGATYALTADQQRVPHYLSMYMQVAWQTQGSYWALFTYLYVDGTAVGSAAWYDPQHGYSVPGYTGSVDPVEVSFSTTTPTGAAAPLSGTVQRLSFNTGPVSGSEFWALRPTLDQRRIALDFVGEEINTGVVNGPLDTAPIGFPDTSNTTLLDLANDVIRTEGGHLFAQTTGTLTGVGAGANAYIQFRARDRPLNPKATFDAVTETSGYPTFIRDITNVLTSVEVTGPSASVTVTNPTAGNGLGRYATAGQSETVLYANIPDLRGWGQDRINRGINRQVRTQQFTVDAATTTTDRSADLLGLIPGDRLRLTGLPADRLGFSSWDGWLLGASETHTPTSNSFTFQLQTVTPDPALADVARFTSNDDITLTAAATSTAGTITITNMNLSIDLPYLIQVDAEKMAVTGLNGGTVTVTRGVNGTTPATHTSGALVEISPTALYAY